MSFISYFKPVTSIDRDEAQEMIKRKKPEEIIILDVRQLKEYERGHVPGAKLIPIGELEERLNELDPNLPTICYCAIGGRSRAAASILQDNGFTSYNLKGGFNAWNGLSVKGPPETGMAYFRDIQDPKDVLLLAWAMEEGSRRFYEKMSDSAGDDEARGVYYELAQVEVKHQQLVTDLYYQITGLEADDASPFYTRYLTGNEMEQLMEGQMKIETVIAWAEEHTLVEVLEFAIALEAKLYDLYFRMQEKYTEPAVNKIYARLAKEEKQHLDRFLELLEKNLG